MIKILNKKTISSFLSMMKGHPFITAAFICFACLPLTGEKLTPLAPLISGMILFCICSVFSIYISENTAEKSRKSMRICLIIISAVLSALFGYMLSCASSPGLVVLNAGLAFIAAAAGYFIASRKIDTQKTILLIFIAAVIFRLAYIMVISIKIKQHDVYSLKEMKGHLGYIGYLVFHNALPDIDVRTVNQFYHPPLHHIISAMWVKFQNGIGISADNLWENIQVLTMFYSCCCMIISYKIFRQLGLEGKGLVIAFAITAFCPTFIIMSGSINNDMLCLTLMLAAVLNTLYWYKSRSFGRIMCIAVSVGCAMMAKLSGWMVAPAIAAVFIYVFFKEIKSWKKYLTQFAAFITVCAPLGLWWGVRNYITHEVPITYIWELSERSGQYVGDIPVLQRLFDFNPSQFRDIGDQFTQYGGAYNEYNPLIALFKTSVFDETFTKSFYPSVAGIDNILFWSAVILGLVGFASMIYSFIRDKKLSFIHKLFIGLLYVVILASYFIFCIKFPQVCTENIRYAVPVIVVGAYFVGRLVMNMLSSSNSKTHTARLCGISVIISVTVIYCLMSLTFFDTVFITK